LEGELKRAVLDTVRINLLHTLSKVLRRSDLEKSLTYAKEELDLAVYINNESKIANAYSNIGENKYYKGDFGQALSYFEKSLELLKQTNAQKDLATIYQRVGDAHSLQDNDNKALSFYLKALHIKEELDDMKGIANLYIDMAVIHQYQSNYNKSLELLFTSLKISGSLNDKNGMATSCFQVALIYALQKQAVKSIEYANKALNHIQETGNKKDIGTYYSRSGYIHNILKNYVSALKFYNNAIKIAKELKDQMSLIYNYGGVGRVLLEAISDTNYKDLSALNNLLQSDSIPNSKEVPVKKMYNHALKFLLKGDSISERLNIQKHISWSILIDIGDIHIKNNEPLNAIPYLKKAINSSRTHKNKYYESLSNKKLYEAYIALVKKTTFIQKREKHYQYAIQTLQQYHALNDSIFNETNSKQIAEMQTKYETEKKEQEIVVLSKENEIQKLQNKRNQLMLYGLGGSVLLIVLIAVLFVIQYRLRAKQKAVELEQKLLRSQMNPHFIFNSLNAIQSFIYKSDMKESAKYISSFAKLMRLILENSREEYITLEKEIQTLEHYLELQQLRFDNKFDFKLIVDSEIDQEEIAIPPMLAQPFIENALEHGIQHKDNKGHINVSFKKEDSMISFVVEDDGIGRERSEELKESKNGNHRSFATIITEERLTNLNKKSKRKIKFEITDLGLNDLKNTGTKVSFSIPFRTI